MMLDNITKVATATTTLVILFAVTYEWSYFAVIGTTLLSLFSPYDYIASAVSWLPTSAAIMVVSLAFNFLGRPQTETQHSVTGWTIHIMGAFSVAMAIVSFFNSNVPPTLAVLIYGLAACYLWAMFGIRMLLPALKGRSLSTILIAIFLPIIVINVFGWGNRAAHSDMDSRRNVYSLQLKGNIVGRPVSLLRILDRGVIVRELDSRVVTFFRWDRIDGLSKDVETANRAHSCVVFGVFCQ